MGKEGRQPEVSTADPKFEIKRALLARGKGKGLLARGGGGGRGGAGGGEKDKEEEGGGAGGKGGGGGRGKMGRKRKRRGGRGRLGEEEGGEEEEEKEKEEGKEEGGRGGEEEDQPRIRVKGILSGLLFLNQVASFASQHVKQALKNVDPTKPPLPSPSKKKAVSGFKRLKIQEFKGGWKQSQKLEVACAKIENINPTKRRLGYPRAFIFSKGPHPDFQDGSAYAGLLVSGLLRHPKKRDFLSQKECPIHGSQVLPFEPGICKAGCNLLSPPRRLQQAYKIVLHPLKSIFSNRSKLQGHFKKQTNTGTPQKRRILVLPPSLHRDVSLPSPNKVGRVTSYLTPGCRASTEERINLELREKLPDKVVSVVTLGGFKKRLHSHLSKRARGFLPGAGTRGPSKCCERGRRIALCALKHLPTSSHVSSKCPCSTERTPGFKNVSKVNRSCSRSMASHHQLRRRLHHSVRKKNLNRRCSRSIASPQRLRRRLHKCFSLWNLHHKFQEWDPSNSEEVPQPPLLHPCLFFFTPKTSGSLFFFSLCGLQLQADFLHVLPPKTSVLVLSGAQKYDRMAKTLSVSIRKIGSSVVRIPSVA
ncbi:Protein no-on-transient A, partial [Ophiophagus hannah]